jgi:Transposase domain (DUF772)
MRGSDIRTGELFSYVDLEQRVPESHPLRLIRRIVNEVLAALDGEFGKLYVAEGRPSIAPERLLRALLLQAFYSIRSERQLMEQLHYNLLTRWFVGLGVDDRVLGAGLGACCGRRSSPIAGGLARTPRSGPAHPHCPSAIRRGGWCSWRSGASLTTGGRCGLEINARDRDILGGKEPLLYGDVERPRQRIRRSGDSDHNLFGSFRPRS